MADKVDKILNQLGIGMDKRLADLVLEAFHIMKDSADDGTEDMLDIIDQAENHDDALVHGEWCYLLGVADALDLTISQVIEEAQCPSPK
jgi:hypothetical protein